MNYPKIQVNCITQTQKQSSESSRMLYNRVCTGYTGIVLKAVGALAVLVVIYVIGYVTGYYVHRCPK
uniref:Small integral membrane protein 1 n=1 Tax=Poecilia latipinna TaxID=48699 RepID=A0A3B3TXP9_9TELE